MSASQDPYSDDRGTYFLALGWTLTSLAVVAVVTRLYTRLVLTKSAGSDDFAIAFCVPLTVAGMIGDSIAVAHGLGRHQEYLDDSRVASVVKWEYIDLINVFISLFFLRSSVMLFTLRLLPASKIWPQRIIVVAFFLNIAIMLIVTITYGVKCVPFKAIYEDLPGASCAPNDTVVITQQVNGILACIIDVTAALIPAFLLWRIRIKRSTEIVLDVIFLFGLVTAALSIGRAATSNTGIWQEDTTWRIQVPNTFSMVEEKAGICFACGPALRQFVVHLHRAKSILPKKRQSGPGEDFVKMRKKIKLRDIFWFRKPQRSQLETFTGSPIYPPETYIDSRTHAAAEQGAKKSPLDVWFTSLGAVFGSKSAVRRLSLNDNAVPGVETEPPVRTPKSTSEGVELHSWPGTKYVSEKQRIQEKYQGWHLSPTSPNFELDEIDRRRAKFAPAEPPKPPPSTHQGSFWAGSETSSQQEPESSRTATTSKTSKFTLGSSGHTNFSRPRKAPSSRLSLQEALHEESMLENG